MGAAAAARLEVCPKRKEKLEAIPSRLGVTAREDRDVFCSFCLSKNNILQRCKTYSADALLCFVHNSHQVVYTLVMYPSAPTVAPQV